MTNPSDPVEEIIYQLITAFEYQRAARPVVKAKDFIKPFSAKINRLIVESRIEEVRKMRHVWHYEGNYGTHNFDERIQELEASTREELSSGNIIPQELSNQPTPKVTRVEVIDDSGRAYTKWSDNLDVQLSYQDDGRTLKVFIKEPSEEE